MPLHYKQTAAINDKKSHEFSLSLI